MRVEVDGLLSGLDAEKALSALEERQTAFARLRDLQA
jgi:hypothetical protein